MEGHLLANLNITQVGHAVSPATKRQQDLEAYVVTAAPGAVGATTRAARIVLPGDEVLNGLGLGNGFGLVAQRGSGGKADEEGHGDVKELHVVGG